MRAASAMSPTLCPFGELAEPSWGDCPGPRRPTAACSGETRCLFGDPPSLAVPANPGDAGDGGDA